MKKAGLLQNLIFLVLVIPKNCKADVNSRLAQTEKEILSLKQQQQGTRNDIHLGCCSSPRSASDTNYISHYF